MDTWWNEAIEQQAIDRVHRLGQNKPVFVTRYIIKGTVGEWASTIAKGHVNNLMIVSEKRIMKIRQSGL